MVNESFTPTGRDICGRHTTPSHETTMITTETAKASIPRATERDLQDYVSDAPIDWLKFHGKLSALPEGSSCTPEALAPILLECDDLGHEYGLNEEGALTLAIVFVELLKVRVKRRSEEIQAAFAHARRLMDTLGDVHPQTLAAVFDALELQEPGSVGRMAQECGVSLPKPDHCDSEGKPLFSSEAIAKAFNVPHEKVVADIKAMSGEGVIAPAGAAHRLQ